MGSHFSSESLAGTGLRVLKVLPFSPCYKAGIEPFFDFILGIFVDNKEISFQSEETRVSEKELLQNFNRIISENQNKSLGFRLFNVYSQKARDLQISPTRNWPNSESLLGILIRKESFADALEKTFKILNVLENSPAALSGLVAEEDFILGMTYFKYNDVQEFKEALLERPPAESKENLKEVCVFSNKTKEIRFVTLKTNEKWGGQGLLGCEFGFGHMNNLKPGLEDIQHEGKDKQNGSPLKEKRNFKEESARIKQISNHKLKIPPKNPFIPATLQKKSSFDKISLLKDKNEKDFLEINFIGVPKYDDPPDRENNSEKKEESNKNNENSELFLKSANSSFLLNSILEQERVEDNKSFDKSFVERESENAKEVKTKILTKYSFYATKINKDYIIKSDELFKLNIPIN